MKGDELTAQQTGQGDCTETQQPYVGVVCWRLLTSRACACAGNHTLQVALLQTDGGRALTTMIPLPSIPIQENGLSEQVMHNWCTIC